MADETTEVKTDSAAPPDIAKAVEAVLAKHGDPNAALRAVLADRDTLRDQLTEVKAKLPKEGHVVLDPDSAKLFGAYQSLGKPEDIRGNLERLSTVDAELGGLKHKEHIAEVAALVKFKPSVLGKLSDEVEIVIKDEPDAKDPTKKSTVRVPHVKLDGDRTEPLTAYAERQWKDWLPSLKVEQSPTPAPRGTPSFGSGPPRPPVVSSDQTRRSLVS